LLAYLANLVYTAPMPNIAPKIQDKSFFMKVSAEFLQALDAIREAKGFPTPPRAEVVRELVFREAKRSTAKKKRSRA